MQILPECECSQTHVCLSRDSYATRDSKCCMDASGKLHWVPFSDHLTRANAVPVWFSPGFAHSQCIISRGCYRAPNYDSSQTGTQFTGSNLVETRRCSGLALAPTLLAVWGAFIRLSSSESRADSVDVQHQEIEAGIRIILTE